MAPVYLPEDHVPLSLIDVPKKWRRVNKATVAELADSIRIDGLLQPIGVRPIGDRYRLVYGRHRLEALRKLGAETIPAVVRDLDDVAEQSATDAENLFANPLTKAERTLAMKRWHQRYVAEHPESHGDGLAIGRADLHEERDEEHAPTFAQHAADTTGVSRSLIELQVQIGKNLTDDELFVLADRDVTQDNLKALSKMKNDDQKRAAITLIASGLDPKEAIFTASQPANATFSEVKGDGVLVKAEADLTDEEWLESICGDVLAKLKFQTNYKRDALLYRHTADIRHKFKMSMKNHLAQGKIQPAGPFFLLLTKQINTDHPKNWQHCGPCGGTGMNGDISKCGSCNGHAYYIKSGAR